MSSEPCASVVIPHSAAVRFDGHPAQRRRARVHVAGGEDLADRHRDRRLPVPAPPADGRVVVARRKCLFRGHIAPSAVIRAHRPRLARYPRSAVVEEKNDAAKDINDPELLAQQAREAIEKSSADLRKTRVPIETEPPTVYRP